MVSDRAAVAGFRLEPVWLAAMLLAVALATWLVLIERMVGMDQGPGTDLGGLGWFVGVWVTMMAAMMLPSVAPMVLLFARVSRQRALQKRAHVPAWIFVLGYLAVWTAFGLFAYGVYGLVAALEDGLLAWDRAGPYVAGGAVAGAGLYQLTPLKAICLRHCRGPMHFMLHGWREGRFGALQMGVAHGTFCVGCCWGLMLALFALGVMSVFWMAVVAAVVFAEKVLPSGERASRAASVALVALGLWIAVAPEKTPGLTNPRGTPGMHGGQMNEDMPGSDSPGRPGEGMVGP